LRRQEEGFAPRPEANTEEEKAMDPFFMNIDFKSGDLKPNDRVNVRRLSDMKGMFLDGEAERRVLAEDDPVIYSFGEKVLPEEPGHLQIAITTFCP